MILNGFWRKEKTLFWKNTRVFFPPADLPSSCPQREKFFADNFGVLHPKDGQIYRNQESTPCWAVPSASWNWWSSKLAAGSSCSPPPLPAKPSSPAPAIPPQLARQLPRLASCPDTPSPHSHAHWPVDRSASTSSQSEHLSYLFLLIRRSWIYGEKSSEKIAVKVVRRITLGGPGL